ncbi:MAG: hypothetical protein GYB68_18560 [Chloroflexi bacterium]|nr:hypothetical protein [Chloroflexota bacterium]
MRNSNGMGAAAIGSLGLIAFVVVGLIAFGARTLNFYGLQRYQGPDLARSAIPTVDSLSGSFDPVADLELQDALVLIDTGHNNGFDEQEMDVFLGRLTSNGAQVEFVGGSDLIEGLRGASALVILAPSSDFDQEEIDAIEGFVDKGGRVVVVGEPTRQRSVDGINSLTRAFDIVYRDAYIYSLTNNDSNFRHVIYENFGGNSVITDGLEQVVFQTAYPLAVESEMAIIEGDDSTFISTSELPGGVVAAALAGNGNFLALPDLTFLTSPYNGFADNDQLIDNIVTFALSGERVYDLADFPFFYEGRANLVYQDVVTLNNALADTIDLRNSLSSAGVDVDLVESYSSQQNVLYLATYAQSVDSEAVAQLAADGIQLSTEEIDADEEDESTSNGGSSFGDDDEEEFSPNSIIIRGVAQLQSQGTVIIHLVTPQSGQVEDEAEADAGDEEETSDEEAEEVEVFEDPHQVLILADDEEVLAEGIDILLSGDFSECLTTDFTAVCQVISSDLAGDDDVEEAPEPTPGIGADIGSVLVVADDIVSGDSETINAEGVQSVLDNELGGEALLWFTSSDGLPTVDDLFAFDAVIWSNGTYCCDGITEDHQTVMSEYLDGGGKLVLSGTAIAFETRETDFQSNYLRVEYLDFGELLSIIPQGHPVSENFDDEVFFAGEVGSPDRVLPVGSTDIVFTAGDDSPAPGEAVVTAYADGSQQVVFSTFPIGALDEFDLTTLLDSILTWFSAP